MRLRSLHSHKPPHPAAAEFGDADLNPHHDPSAREAQARLRFSIIGALFAAPPAKGDLLGVLRVLAAKCWRQPATGLDLHFGVATLRRWY